MVYFKCRSAELFPFSEFDIMGWMALSLISFGLCCAMLGLCMISLVYTAHNVTKIDLLKGTFKLKDKQNLSPNPYDIGTISNFSDLF